MAFRGKTFCATLRPKYGGTGNQRLMKMNLDSAFIVPDCAGESGKCFGADMGSVSVEQSDMNRVL